MNGFDASKPAEAVSAFTFAGHPYKAGESFPHQALGVVPFDLAGMWRAGLIRFVEPRAPVSADPDALSEAELEVMTAPARPAPQPHRTRR